ncbi:MAG: hypothetical protein R3C15_02035 [Thermoleophilia bacterium]
MTELAPPIDTVAAAGVSPPVESGPPPAATFDPSTPPVLVARLAAGGGAELELDPVSFCSPALCSDGSPRPPTEYLRVRRGESVRVALVDAEASTPHGCSPYCVQGLLSLWPLECVDGGEARFGDAVVVAPFGRRGGEIRLDAPPGSYLLGAFVYWSRADGTGGDVFAMGGVRIARDGSAGLVSAAEAGCRPPRLPERAPLERAPAGTDGAGCTDVAASFDRLLLAATAVFVGPVTETGVPTDPDDGSSGRVVRVAVTEPLRATVPSSVELAWPDCAGDPSGRTYLVLAGPSDAPDRPLALLDAYLVDTSTGEATNAAGETVSVQAVIDRVGGG